MAYNVFSGVEVFVTKHLRIAIAVLGLLFVAGSAVADDFSDGVEAYNRGDYAEALKLLLPPAEQGYADAQFNLGIMYSNGEGVPEDDAEAVKWYRKAAEQDHARAQNNLGYMYSNGRGVPQDYAEAVKWYRKAAEQDHARAQNNLGVMYSNGRGVPEDDAEAAKWRCRAAEQGDEQHIKWCLEIAHKGSAETQYKLGELFQRGQGVEQDDDKAARWICSAAKKGLSEASMSCRKMASSGAAAAQYHLGVMHAQGSGVLQDIGGAHMWLNIAAANGFSDAVGERDGLAKKLSGEQLEKANERAKRCMDADYKDCDAKAKSWWQKLKD
jgi:TPR repeat protein